jgi:Uma2 family endonuclease
MTLMHDEALVRHRRFTVDEYHRMAEAGVLTEDDRVELLDGEVVVMAPIGARHAACVDRLNELLVFAAARRAIVRVQNPVRLDDHSEPQPDVVLVRRAEDFHASRTPGPEDTLLAIEVGDSSVRFDRDVKAPLYARTGIIELWLVDLGANEVSVCRRPGPDGYGDMRVKRVGDVLSPQALPEVALKVDEVLV